MANEIKQKFGTPAALTMTIAALASSTAGVGRQSTTVDNSTTRYQKLVIMAKVTTGTSPTTAKSIKLYLIRSDGTYYTDGAGASDAALTVVNAQLIAAVATIATNDKPYYLEATIYDPPDEWGVAIVHDTGVNLNSTGGNHYVRYVGMNPEVQ